MALSLDEALGMSLADEADESIHVNVNTRQITIPESQKLFGVESDADVEVKHIVIDGRYADSNRDLSKLAWRVIYRNANKETSYYLIPSVVANENSIEMDWLIKRSVVAYKGTVDFILCAFATNSSGEVTPEWNSTLGQGIVLEGLETSAIDIGKESVDELSKILYETITARDAAAKSAEAADNTANSIKDSMTQIAANKEAVSQLKEDLGDFIYTGKWGSEYKYSLKPVSVVPQKGDLIFFAANECSSRFFDQAVLSLYYTENDSDLISISNVGDYKIYVSEKNYIKAIVSFSRNQLDESNPTWKATVMSSREYNLSGIIMQLYALLDNDVKLRKTDIENLKNDLISKHSGRFAVSKSGRFSYVDFPTKTGDKGFIFVSETNASKFLSYSLFGHDATSNTLESIKEHISDIGNIYTYDNSSGYDYLRIFFECSAPSTEDEYLTCVFTKDTDTDAFGLITKLFADVKNMKEIPATTTKVNIPDVAYEDVLSTITIKASNSKKNNIIGFEANFENMGSVRIAHGTSYDSNRSASIVVDATNIYLYDKSTNLRATYPHSLSMDKFITVSIVVGHTRTAKIILTTANGRFMQDDVYWGGCCEDITAQVVAGAFTNARLTWYVPDYNYDLWCFGDSYFDFWGFDVTQRLGFHNFMLDGFGGRDSTDAFVSLELALEKAVPKKIMWCLGMNDRDTETAINAKWKETVDSIIDLCNKKGIELILCTIPETPVAVHTFKNAYVKASGKRYVDVCHAVGADVSNTWYDGMLNKTDKIHPTDLGESVIADYMIANVPELCVN